MYTYGTALTAVDSESLETTLAKGLSLAQRSLEIEALANPSYNSILASLEPERRHELACNLWRNFIQMSQSLKVKHKYLQLLFFITPITRLPTELLQRVFLIIIEEATETQWSIMGVCKRWYEGVTGIWASLNLGTTTARDAVTKKLERNPWLLDIVINTEVDRHTLQPSETAYQGVFSAIEAAARWRSIVIEGFPGQTDLSEEQVQRGLQGCSNTDMSRLTTFKIKCACEMSPLLIHLLSILAATTREQLTTVEINSANVISFLLAPSYSTVFHSVKVLHLDTLGPHAPVDLLPHLHQLESLIASHLSLPFYAHDLDLPFVHTLRYLKLRAVSVQWMRGRTFRALKTCILILPRNHHTIGTLRIILPECRDLTLEGYPLTTLNFSTDELACLSVSSQGNKWRGTVHLAWLCSQAARFTLRVLHVVIEATSQAWITVLGLMADLEELVIESAHPSSLGVTVMQSLIAKPVPPSNPGIKITLMCNARLCPSLKQLALKYRRWLRPSEDFTILPECMSIIWSRQWSNCSLQSFRIWKTNDQQEPLELIEDSNVNFKGFKGLANDGGIEGGNFLDSSVRKLVQSMVMFSDFTARGQLRQNDQCFHATTRTAATQKRT